MGIYLNPGSRSFEKMIHSEIYNSIKDSRRLLQATWNIKNKIEQYCEACENQSLFVQTITEVPAFVTRKTQFCNKKRL